MSRNRVPPETTSCRCRPRIRSFLRTAPTWPRTNPESRHRPYRLTPVNVEWTRPRCFCSRMSRLFEETRRCRWLPISTWFWTSWKAARWMCASTYTRRRISFARWVIGWCSVYDLYDFAPNSLLLMTGFRIHLSRRLLQPDRVSFYRCTLASGLDIPRGQRCGYAFDCFKPWVLSQICSMQLS